jgi:hypothetical protein
MPESSASHPKLKAINIGGMCWDTIEKAVSHRVFPRISLSEQTYPGGSHKNKYWSPVFLSWLLDGLPDRGYSYYLKNKA